MPRNFSQQKNTVKILYHSPNDRDLTLNYPDYEKVEFKHYL